MNKVLPRLAPVMVLYAPLLAHAQTQPADAADVKAPAPALRYQSAFDDYKAWQDIKPGDWRHLNDRVATASGKAAGHMGNHGATAAPEALAPVPAVPHHKGPHMHGGKP